MTRTSWLDSWRIRFDPPKVEVNSITDLSTWPATSKSAVMVPFTSNGCEYAFVIFANIASVFGPSVTGALVGTSSSASDFDSINPHAHHPPARPSVMNAMRRMRRNFMREVYDSIVECGRG